MTNPAAAPLQVDDQGVRDFTMRRPPVVFRIDDDVFHAPNVIAPVKLRALAAAAGSIDMSTLTEQSGDDEFRALIARLGSLFATLIGGKDGKLFADRMASEGLKAGDEREDGTLVEQDDPLPIDLISQVIPVLWFLLESYGMRPTVPPSPSPTGSMDGAPVTVGDGTSSTDGASPSE
jgi:hypothetical protein